jgi:hypothetical protein
MTRPIPQSTTSYPRRPGWRGAPLRAAVGVLVSAALSGPVGAANPPAAPPPAAAAAPAGQLTVTAKLVEIPGKFPDDELYDYAYVMRYVVVGGPMDKQPIFVAHYKPKQPRAAIKDKMKSVVSGKVRTFHQGDVHKLQLTGDLKSVWKGALVDEFSAVDRKSTRYFALVTDPA